MAWLSYNLTNDENDCQEVILSEPFLKEETNYLRLTTSVKKICENLPVPVSLPLSEIQLNQFTKKRKCQSNLNDNDNDTVIYNLSHIKRYLHQCL